LPWLVFNRDLHLGFKNHLPDKPFFWAKRDEVLFCLGNLETNAEKACKRKACDSCRIVFAAMIRRLDEVKPGGTYPEYVVLSVADNGAGMSPAMKGQLFRGPVVTGLSGHGLGSRIIRRVMDNHRGLIRLATCEGVGTLVELWFPRVVNSHGASLHDQWTAYEKIREDLGPILLIGEEALLAALEGTLHPDRDHKGG